MDEAYVVLVASEGVAQAFPFATRVAAEKASEWFKNVTYTYFSSVVIDDHEAE